MAKFTGINYDGKIEEVQIGDLVGFYDDDDEEIEQIQEVVQIKTHGSSIVLIFENEDSIKFRDCWIEGIAR